MKRVAAALVLLCAARAGAVEYRAIGGADLLLATGPGFDGLANAELGLQLRADVRNVKNILDLKLDFAGREAFTGNSSFNNLYELKGVVHGLAGRIDMTLGRMRVPGGFWLIADGAMLTIHYTSWLKHSVYAGLRSFTTGRRNTWMSEQPVALPLAGTSLAVRHRLVQAELTFSYAQDGVDLHTGRIPIGMGPDGGKNTLERHVTDEFFLDGYVQVYPHDKVFLTAGASLGTRYDVMFNATNPFGATSLGVTTLGAVGAYALGEVRPIRTLRLMYTFNFERVRLVQSELLTLKPDGTPVQTADGSFQDHALRVVWLLWRALRADVGYRLRYRATTDIQHRFTVGLRGDDLWRGLGGFVSVGVDNNQLDSRFNRIIYSGGLSYMRHFLDLRAGITFTDGFGSGLVFSAQSPGQGTQPTNLFPYVLESNRVVFVRGFATFWKMYAGLDIEENLDSAQLRILAQIGASL
jgi:hypothetical protein